MMQNTELGAKTVARESQVYSELGILRGMVGRYEDRLKQLEEKLIPIKTNQPRLQKEEKEVHDTLVPLAEEIRDIREKVESLNDGLTILIADLEI